MNVEFLKKIDELYVICESSKNKELIEQFRKFRNIVRKIIIVKEETNPINEVYIEYLESQIKEVEEFLKQKEQ